MKTEGQEESTLNDFTGFSAEKFDFFGENSEGIDITADNLLEAVKNDDPVVEPNKDKETDKVDVAEIFDWAGTDDDADNGEEDTDPEAEVVNTTTPKKDKPTPIVINSKSTLDFLKNKGFLDYELPDGKTELTDEEADDILEDSWENSLDAAISDTVKDLDPIAKAILQVAKNGGDVRGMIKPDLFCQSCTALWNCNIPYSPVNPLICLPPEPGFTLL